MVLGAITETDGDPATVCLQGMRLLPPCDPRLPAAPAVNRYGFAIDLASIAAGALTAAAG